MDINIRKIEEKEKFTDARLKIREVTVRVGLPKTLFYWAAISRWALIVLAALAPVFFLPFTNLPVAVHKEFLIFVLILVAFFALLGRILIEGRMRYPGHWIAAALVVLVLVWGAAAFFSVNQSGSLIGSWATPDSFFSMLLFVFLTLSIVMSFDRRDIVISLLAFLASLSLLGIFELLQLMKIFILPFEFSKNAAFNPVGSVNDIAARLFASIPRIEEPAEGGGRILLGINNGILKKFLGILVAILLFNLVVIDFWAIWVGLALAMVFMISFLSAGLQNSISSIPSIPSIPGTIPSPLQGGANSSVPGIRDSVPGINQGLQLAYFQKVWLPSIILLISLFFLFIPSPFSKFIQAPVEVSPTFRATLDIARENFGAGRYLLGSGPNTFGYIFNLYKPAGINQSIFWSTVFNSGASALATWVGTVGILGVLAILFFMAAFIWTGIKVRIASVSQAIFVAVSFLFIMWFLYVANFTVMAFAFWGMGIFLASLLILRIEESAEGGGRILRINSVALKEIRIFTSPPKTFLFSLLIVGLMVGAVIGIYFEANRYIAEIYFSKADYTSAVRFWRNDERYFQSLSQAVFFQLNDLLAQKDLPQETLRARFQNISTNAISAAREAQNLNPQNPVNSVLLGSIYENLIPFIADAANFALFSYSGAAALDPQNPSNYLALARVEIAQADLAVNQKASNEEINGYLDKAASNLEKSIGLKNDYAPARFLLVQVFDRQGKLTDAVKKAEELVILNNQNVGALFQLGFLYYKNSQFNESKLVFEKTVQLSPNYSNARYFLGLIYDRESIGAAFAEVAAAKARAIEQFRKIAEFNPDNNEVKQILANLKAKKPALFGIAPPAPAPQSRSEAPVQEGATIPVKPLRNK